MLRQPGASLRGRVGERESGSVCASHALLRPAPARPREYLAIAGVVAHEAAPDAPRTWRGGRSALPQFCGTCRIDRSADGLRPGAGIVGWTVACCLQPGTSSEVEWESGRMGEWEISSPHSASTQTLPPCLLPGCGRSGCRRSGPALSSLRSRPVVRRGTCRCAGGPAARRARPSGRVGEWGSGGTQLWR